MQFKFKFGKKAGSSGSLISNIGNFWQKIYVFVFFVCLAVAIALGFYIWQKSLTDGAWSDEKKQEYLNSQSSEIVLKENDYKKALSDIETRKNNSANIENKNNLKDVFKNY